MIWRRWVTESSSSAPQTTSDHLDRRLSDTRTRPPHSGFVQVLVLYLKCPRAKSGELSCCGGALQIQRLEGSRPGGLWDLYLDGAVLIVCEFAVAIRALGFQERVAERTGVGKRIRESESHHLTAF